MKLDVGGQTITRISFEHGIILLLADGTQITIETPFEVAHRNGETTRFDPQGVAGAADVLAALHDDVEAAEYDDYGTLQLTMKNSTWIVKPDPDYESWGLVGPGTPSRVHSGPGPSNVGVWS